MEICDDSLGMFGTGTGGSDVMVVYIMDGLSLKGAWHFVRQTSGKLTGAPI